MLATAYVLAGKTHSCLSTGPFQAPSDWIPRHRWDFCRRQPRHSKGTPQPSSFQRPDPKTARLWVAVDLGLPFRPRSAAARGAIPRARPAERGCAPGMRGRSRRRRGMRGALEMSAPRERGPSAPPGGGWAAGEALRFEGKAQPGSGHVSRGDPTGPAAAPPAAAAQSARYRRSSSAPPAARATWRRGVRRGRGSRQPPATALRAFLAPISNN